MTEDIDELVQAAQRVQGKFSLNDEFRAASVAAAIRTRSGKIFTGISIDLACGIGFCAEHSAIAEMLKDRETEIDMAVAVADSGILPPCGRCRELMVQIDSNNFDTKIVLRGERVVLLRELLPEHWMAWR
jgi:cytidine deaminase